MGTLQKSVLGRLRERVLIPPSSKTQYTNLGILGSLCSKRKVELQHTATTFEYQRMFDDHLWVYDDYPPLDRED